MAITHTFSEMHSIMVYDFNRCTGQLSNPRAFGRTIPNSFYGISFSPNGSKLYSSDHEHIYQFNLNNPDTNNYILIYQAPLPLFQNSGIGHFQLAPDGKIYIATQYFSYDYYPPVYYDTTNKYLSVINNPDALGLPCQFAPLSIYLNGHRTKIGLPNMPNYNLGRLIGSECDTVYDGVSTIKEKVKEFTLLYPNPTSDFAFLDYQIKESDVATLIISDILGRNTGEFNLNPLEGKLKVDLLNYPDGIYTYQIIVNNTFVLNDKIIVIKP